MLTEVPGLNLYRADACEQQAKDANLRAERVRAQLLSLVVTCININFLPTLRACDQKRFSCLFSRIKQKNYNYFSKKNPEKH